VQQPLAVDLLPNDLVVAVTQVMLIGAGFDEVLSSLEDLTRTELDVLQSSIESTLPKALNACVTFVDLLVWWQQLPIGRIELRNL